MTRTLAPNGSSRERDAAGARVPPIPKRALLASLGKVRLLSARLDLDHVCEPF